MCSMLNRGKATGMRLRNTVEKQPICACVPFFRDKLVNLSKTSELTNEA